MDELGLSSLERVELMVALEDRFGTTIDEAAFSGVQSVADLDTPRACAGAPSPKTATP